jgi:hypothetical protein
MVPHCASWMSTYEFQISITPDNYQAQSPLLGHHISHQGAHNAIAGPAPIETPTPEPTIIHYNANKQKPAPYGSGEDGFDLSFSTWDAFSAWKTAEETKKYDFRSALCLSRPVLIHA